MKMKPCFIAKCPWNKSHALIIQGDPARIAFDGSGGLPEIGIAIPIAGEWSPLPWTEGRAGFKNKKQLNAWAQNYGIALYFGSPKY